MATCQPSSQWTTSPSCVANGASALGAIPNCWSSVYVTVSGVYWIKPTTAAAFLVYCKVVNGKKYMEFQRRTSSGQIFYQNWATYAAGFGVVDNNDVSGSSFWLGLTLMSVMTAAPQACQLRVELQKQGAPTVYYADYSSFSISSASTNFVLTALGYSGTAGDALSGRHSGRPFSTFDSGVDTSCAVSYKSAWWYNSCHSSNLNGVYYEGNGGCHSNYADGTDWCATNSITQCSGGCYYTSLTDWMMFTC